MYETDYLFKDILADSNQTSVDGSFVLMMNDVDVTASAGTLDSGANALTYSFSAAINNDGVIKYSTRPDKSVFYDQTTGKFADPVI